MVGWLRVTKPGMSKRSIRDYKSTTKTILRRMEALGLNTDPKKIGPEDLASYYDDLRERNIEVSTGQGYISTLKTYTISANNHTIRDIELAWSQDMRPNADWLTPSDSRKLLNANLDPEQRLLVHLGLCMGLRRVDSIRLKVDYIKWKKKQLEVLGKGHGIGKWRTVDFNPNKHPSMNTEKVLTDYLEFRQLMVDVTKARNHKAVVPDKLLIYTTGNKLGSFSEDGVAIDNRLKEIGRIAGVEFSFHTLRRTFGRALYHSGVRIEDIAAILGHEDPKMTMKYLGLDRVDHSDHMGMLSFGEDD